MIITLEVVRQTLREALGFESFTARFIEKVTEDPDCPTAAINKNGTLTYNPEFTTEHVKTRYDLFSLIFHEVLHLVFGHFIYRAGKLENIAADAVINAVISRIYTDYSGGGELFSKIYAPNGLQGILRPDSEMKNSRYSSLYENLYRNYWYNGRSGMTTGELIQTLKIFAETENPAVILLLGNHGDQGETGIPDDIVGKIAADIKAAIPRNNSAAGYSEYLENLFVEVLKSRISLPRQLLASYATRRKIDRFKEFCSDNRRRTSPIPLYPSKRDMALLACGVWPAYFHNRQQRPNKRNTGLAIYLDVSGSVNDHLPEIIGIIGKLKAELTTLFLFSNKVVETPIKELLKGRVETTWGTDFNCIAKSIIERGFDKAVVITDGYANLSEELSDKLKERKVAILTILFGRINDCSEFKPFGDVVKLEEMN